MRLARFSAIAVLPLLGLLSSARCAAQIPDPGQLPGRTIFYALWHGAPTGEIRKNNSLYALWDDPDFTAARASFVQTMMLNSQKPKDKPNVSREELEQYATLLDNPVLVGYLRRPETPAAAKGTAAKPAHTWNGMFLVYDRRGKEELLSRAVLRMRSSETDIPKLTEITVAGVPSLKVDSKAGTAYWAEFGKYAVSANEAPVFEEILNLVNGKPGGNLLSQSANYQEAKPLLNGGVLEFFLSVPSVKELALDSPASPSSSQLKPFLSALKLDSLHSLAGHVVLDGPRTRVEAAILGDPAPGGLFDIFADGLANPASFAYLSPDTVYYSESQLNFLGIYQTLRRALTQAGGNTSQIINPLESAAETRIGMPLQDALGLTTGEFASLQSSPTLEDNQKIYLLGIRKKPDTLKLMRTLLGDRISSERNEGNVTFLKVSLGGGQSSAGVTQWNFYYLAMTPTVLFGSSKSDTLRKYLAQTAAGADPAPPKTLQVARAKYPEMLNGFTYFDFQKVDWPGLKAQWVAQINKTAKNEKTKEAEANEKRLADWLGQVSPDVFPHHLHTLVGASWKDAKGVHIEEWLE